MSFDPVHCLKVLFTRDPSKDTEDGQVRVRSCPLRLVAATWIVILLGTASVEGSFSFITVECTFTPPDGIAYNTLPNGIEQDISSTAYAEAMDSSGNSAWQVQWSRDESSVSVDIGSGAVLSYASPSRLSVETLARPPVASSSEVLGDADLVGIFTATTGGIKEFRVDFSYTVDMGTSQQGEWARADLFVCLLLHRDSGIPGDMGDFWQVDFDLLPWYQQVADGQDRYLTGGGTLYKQIEFSPDQKGAFAIRVNARSSACTTPAPGGFLLVGIGTVIAGWLRRAI